MSDPLDRFASPWPHPRSYPKMRLQSSNKALKLSSRFLRSLLNLNHSFIESSDSASTLFSLAKPDVVLLLHRRLHSPQWISMTSSSVDPGDILLGFVDNHGTFEKTPEGTRARFITMIMAFLMKLSTLLCSVASSVAGKLPNKVSKEDSSYRSYGLDPAPKEEFRPPSPTPEFTELDLLTSVMRKLGELEKQAGTLQAKPSEMPYEKDELLNATVRRVDALEAELISTKKALHEALMRQEELLAYTDGQRDAKFWKKKFCF